MILFYAIWLGMAAVMLPSCGGSKKSSSMRQLEKHAKRNPVGDDGLPVPPRGSQSKQVRQAIEKQKKQQAITTKEADKAYKDAITRHRSVQTQETRDRMDRNLKETEKRHKRDKEFFVARWFRPKDNIEKIEKRRAKETQKRMAANRKKAEKNTKDHRVSSFKQTERKARKPPDPKDVVHGGGGTYQRGNASTRVNPADIQHGGGGTYQRGSASTRANPADAQHGGGGTYREGRSGKGLKPESTKESKIGTFFKNLFTRKHKYKKG